MNKKILTVAIASSFGVIAFSGTASADMAADASLDFDPLTLACKGAAKPNPGTPPDNCNYGAKIDSGSYFGMDANGDGNYQLGELTALTSGSEGINVNTTQGAVGKIDNTWTFFSGAGNHTTVSDAAISTDDSAGNVTLDFSGWNVNWNGIPFINMGGGDQACGTTDDGICMTKDANNNDVDVGGVVDNGTSVASVVCADGSCLEGSAYTLDYDAKVPFDDASGFGGVSYTLHLEGTIGSAAIPVPAAVWLFGSGLLGLVGVARRRKS